MRAEAGAEELSNVTFNKRHFVGSISSTENIYCPVPFGFGSVRFGLVWFGLVWFGSVRFDLVFAGRTLLLSWQGI